MTGRSYEFRGIDDDIIEAFVGDDGTRELRFPEIPRRRAAVVLTLDDDDARRLGAVLSGARFRPDIPDDVKRHLRDLVVDWVRIESGSLAVGKSLVDLDLHRRTGMNAIAVVRDDVDLPPPVSDIILEADDRVVVFGQLRQLVLVQDLLTG